MADESQDTREDPTREEEEGKEYHEEEGGGDESHRAVDRRRKQDDCSEDEEEESGNDASDRHQVMSNEDKGTVELAGGQEDGELAGGQEDGELAGGQEDGELAGGQEDGERGSVDGNQDEGEREESQEREEDIELRQDSDHSDEEEEKNEGEIKEEEGKEDGGWEENPEGEEEEEENEVLTRDNPMFVPRGPYFYHDSRFDDKDENAETDQPTNETTAAVTKLQCQELDKWEHDLFVAEDQKPREAWEKKKDKEYYENLERRRSRDEGGDGANRSNRGRGSKLGDFMPSQGRRGTGNYREQGQRQNRKDWGNESRNNNGRYPRQERDYRDKDRQRDERREGQYNQERYGDRGGNRERKDFGRYNQERNGDRGGNREQRNFGQYNQERYSDRGGNRERRDFGQYNQERYSDRGGNRERRDFGQYNQERYSDRGGNRERRDFNKRRGNWEESNQPLTQENWDEDGQERESWENDGENWDGETQGINRNPQDREEDGKERKGQRGFKNQGQSYQRDGYNQGRHGHKPQGGGRGAEERRENHQGRQRNNQGRHDGRRENSSRGRDDNEWPNEGNRPSNREGKEYEETQIENEDSTKKDNGGNGEVSDSNPTNQEGESQSLFSFSSSRVFSLSGNDRLVVREVDHSKTSGRRMGRGRGRGRGISSSSKDVGIVGKSMTQSDTNEKPAVTNDSNEGITSSDTSGTKTDPTVSITDITTSDSTDTAVKPSPETSSVSEGQDNIVSDTIESSEADSKGGPGKPKRYSSRRQKPDQSEGTESDKTISSTGMEYPHPPPPPFGYGWVYPPHPSVIPQHIDPNTYQAQQQQLHFYQQQMRLLQDMYSQHAGGTGTNPPLIPILPHLMTPQEQFTLLPTHFPSLTPPHRYPVAGGELKPSPTVDSSHESSPSPAAAVQQVHVPAATEKKHSQAIPIVAPTETQ